MLKASLVFMGQGTGGLFAVERWTIRLAPAFGMAAIAASALVMTEPEARWGKVFVGPTDQPGPLVWRVAIRRGSSEQPQPTAAKLKLVASFGDTSPLVREFATDTEGVAWVRFDRPAGAPIGPIAITLSEGSRVLARGPVSLKRQRWLAGQRNDGGWCLGHHEGNVDIKVGVVDGVVLHSYPCPIVVALSKVGRPLPHQPFSVQAEGATIDGAPEPGRVMLVTDERGVGHLSVRSIDMAAMLTVTVPEPNTSRFVGALPIRAGGLRLLRLSDTLVVSSSIGQEKATIGLLTDNGLVDVRTVQLQAGGDHTSATLTYSGWPSSPLWAMVSSEPELDAGNTIGWPMLNETDRQEAHASRVNPNLLVLDGYSLVIRRLQQQRHRALYTSSLALILLGTLMAWVMIRSNRRHQVQVRQLNRLLEETSPNGVADRTPYALIAVLVMTAATVALAWWTAIGYG